MISSNLENCQNFKNVSELSKDDFESFLCHIRQ